MVKFTVTLTVILFLLHASLPVDATNLGFYPSIPKFLNDNPLPHGVPWGSLTAESSNPDLEVPFTGVTRFYDLHVTRASLNPDGFNRSGILINNQFPGPLVQANWGDNLHVTVHNDIEDEGTAMHWHGQHMRLSPAYDGVPSVSQCPIAPGKTMVYQFRAENYGTSWYHSHLSGQYMDGAFGPMIFYGPRAPNTKYDVDVGPIMLHDHFHVNYYESVRRALTIPPVFDLAQNNLINARNDLNCLPGSNSSVPCDVNKLFNLHFEPGKTYLLRLVNTGSAATQKFSIDRHELTVIANDYVPVMSYRTRVVTLGIGQRSDVLVKATGKPGDTMWLRSELDMDCFALTVQQPLALGKISYPGAPATIKPNTSAYPWDSNNCRNDALSKTTPLFPHEPPATVGTVQEIHMDAFLNSTGHLVWHMNNQSFRGNFNNPILLLSKLGNNSYPDDPQWNVYNFGKNESIRLIVYNYFPLAHPMHLHGHNMWVLNEGHGTWDGSVVNPRNPQRRDVQMISPGAPDNPAFIVLEFEADNPGIWPLHCHIVADVSLGLYVNIMERPDLIRQRNIPFTAAETCREWWYFSHTEFVNQIDSGL